MRAAPPPSPPPRAKLFVCYGLRSMGTDKGSMGAFLFTAPTGDTTKFTKLPKLGTEMMAVVDRFDQGPQVSACS